MRGTSCANLQIDTYPTPASLPPEASALLDDKSNLFATLSWWQVVGSHAIPSGGEALFVTIRNPERIMAVIPMVRSGRRLSSLTTPYTCLYQPRLAAGLTHPERYAAIEALAHFGRSAGIIRFDALPAEGDSITDLETGARAAGRVSLRFDHFGNWYEDVTGLDWAAYLLRRPGALRETIRRRLRRAEKLSAARFELFSTPDQMKSATALYESVYRRSWKDAEPYPAFNVALMQATAALGMLRLGVWSIGSEPVAVQFWVVTGGTATVLKLAHDETFKAHSPGTVLTAMMLRHLLDNEHVKQIDFGRGDDVYKRGWAAQRRQRIGLLLVDPWSPAGLAALIRHAAGRIRAAWRPGQKRQEP